MKEAHRHPSDPDVSVIVPFFNAERYIKRCIRALLAQDLPASQFEILMVDNNSTDRSAEIVARHPRIRMLREPKQGAYAARNRGLTVARGDIVAFTDPDCVPHPDWLARLLTQLVDPHVQVVIGRSDPDSSSSALALLATFDHYKDLYVFGSDDPRLYYGRTNNLAARQSILREHGPFLDVLRGGDTVFVRRVADKSGCAAVRYVPDARVVHLEIDSLRAYYRKVPIYGRSRVGFSHLVDKRPLTTMERLGVLRHALRGGEVSRFGIIPLTGLLAASVALSRCGGFDARVPRRRRP